MVQDLPDSGAREMNRDDQALHEWHFLLRVLRCHERNALAAHAFPHCARLVKTQEFVRIVDEQVEVGEEVFTENSTNAGIGCLNLSESWTMTKGFSTAWEAASNVS